MIKNLLGIFAFSLVSLAAFSQNILFVDDNDNITENSDTMIVALELTMYGNDYTYWNIADSTFGPDSDFMEDFDAVIWYASGDGLALDLWSDGAEGNTELMNYLDNDGQVWLIGADLLYAQYPSTPQTFAAGSFAYDYMGISSYDVQSYGDDSNVGVAQLDRITSYGGFANTISWIFSTAWWVDGVTPRTGGETIYAMGPSGYALEGKTSMMYFRNAGTDVLSSFFDPAIMNSTASCATLIEKSLSFLLTNDLGVDEADQSILSVYPNPASGVLKIASENSENLSFEISDMSGRHISEGVLVNGRSTVELNGLKAGMYQVRLKNGVFRRFVVQ